jgi:predicted dehydrogenase
MTSDHASTGVDDGSRFPAAQRRLRIGMVGGGRIARVQAMAIRLSNRWDLVAGALSSDPATARALGVEWELPPERAYESYQAMAAAEAARPDGVDAVAIATPNLSHHPIARAFLDAGIDVVCDKPLTTTLEDALDLVRRTRAAGLIFGVTHAYAAYPMVRQARALIAAGELGRLRQIHVEYVQEWMAAEAVTAMKHVQWRQDPAQSGATACTADIGTHAHHLACFVSGLEMTSLRAELLVCGAPKRLDDTVFVQARYGGDVPGLLWATQVAPGNFVGLRLRIFGERGGLEWDQENPDFLKVSRLGAPAQLYRRGFGSGVDPAAERLTRVARGNTEGWLEAWANLFTEFAVAIAARREGRVLPAGLVQHPTVEDGARGMQFIDAVVSSHAAGGAWVDCALRV